MPATLRPSVSPQRWASRWMCVSTGKAGTPKACAITTEAVLWPTPGRASNAPKSAGTTPPCRSSTRRDKLDKARAFCGANPNGRMIPRMTSTGSAASDPGSGASAKRRGVTWLTLASVHCAESTTATSKVKASPWASGIGGAG